MKKMPLSRWMRVAELPAPTLAVCARVLAVLGFPKWDGWMIGPPNFVKSQEQQERKNSRGRTKHDFRI